MHFGDGAGNVKYPTMSEMEHTLHNVFLGIHVSNDLIF